MAFIIEDGSNVTNSNSYVTVEDADAYHSMLGNTDWTALDNDNPDELALKQSALIKATQSVDLLYGDNYKAVPLFNEQSLLFPRMTFIKNRWQTVIQGTIPKELKDAVCEIALKALNDEDVFPNINLDNNVKSKDSAVGPLKKSVTYFKSNNTETYKGFGKVDKLLVPILVPAKTTSGIMSL